MKNKNKKTKATLVLACCLLVVALLFGGFFVYACNYYHADASVWQAAASHHVTIKSEQAYLVIAPGSGHATTGYVFYQGGKVQAEAYLPYLAAVAQAGYFCVLLKLPFNLAVFNINAAAKPIAANPGIAKWAVGGHSLGGVAAASFAGGQGAPVQGLVLLAAYSSKNIAASPLAVISVTASEDKVLNWQNFEEGRAKLPQSTQYINIPGGNHGQFGMYGQQNKDGTPAISAQQQCAAAAKATIQLLARL